MLKHTVAPLLCLIAACQHTPTNTAAADCNGAAAEPLKHAAKQRWDRDQNYYALIELIDKHFANRGQHALPLRKDVTAILGPPNWGTVQQDPNTVYYQGADRHVPYQDKAAFRFDQNDRLVEISWVSE